MSTKILWRFAQGHTVHVFSILVFTLIAAAAVKHTTRTLSGPPSTGAAIAMDGGVADTACYYTGR